MKDYGKYIIIGVSLILCSFIFYKGIINRNQYSNVIEVKGLGETEFTSDLIIWTASYSVDSEDKQKGYAAIEQQRKTIKNYLVGYGIPDSCITFNSVSLYPLTRSLYNANGSYAGEKNIGTRLTQTFTIQSTDVEKVEKLSRDISQLIGQGVNIEPNNPNYYYTKLNDVKLSLIEKASNDAQARAQAIAEKSGSKLGELTSATLGVFQITGAYSNEDYEYGGTLNVTSKEKVGRITVRAKYNVK